MSVRTRARAVLVARVTAVANDRFDTGERQVVVTRRWKSNGETHRRLAAIMLTDMVAYSAFARRDGALALELLRERRRPTVAEHGGREVNETGDGFLIEVASALQAMRSAIATSSATG